MRYGTVSKLWNDRSITRHLKKETERVLSGNMPGEDFAMFRSGPLDSLILADGFASTEEASPAGVLAMLRADNQLAAGGAECLVCRLSVIMGADCPEDTLRREMLAAVRFAEKTGWEIAGGNTVFAGPGEQLSVTVTAVGKPAEGFAERPSGNTVLAAGYAGAFGGALLAEKLLENPSQPFAKSYLETAADPGELSARQAAGILRSLGITEMKDVSFGGVYRAASELAERRGCGITLLHEGIPVRQDTIEICEYLKKNPYTLTGTGGLLAVCPEEKAEKALAMLFAEGIPCGAAGILTEEKARKVWSEKSGRDRFLEDYRPEQDGT